MRNIRIGTRVRRNDGVEFTVCGRAEFKHDVTPTQAEIIAKVACINCVGNTYVARAQDVQPLHEESAVLTREPGDWGEILWGD